MSICPNISCVATFEDDVRPVDYGTGRGFIRTFDAACRTCAAGHQTHTVHAVPGDKGYDASPCCFCGDRALETYPDLNEEERV